MKKILFALLGSLALSLSSLAYAGNYIITIDGIAYEIDLNQPKNIKTKQGVMAVSLAKKAIGTYSSDGVSFEHPSNITPTSTQLNADTKQIMMIEGTGNLFLLQVYKNIDTSTLIPIMESELTKEEVGVGYKKTSRPTAFKLNNGDILRGRKVRTEDSKSSDFYDRYILSCTTAGGGIIAVIQTSELELDGQDKHSVTKSLKSLKAKCTGGK
jgi:hypothetical protein